jgi:hypothetical protein
MHGALGTAMSKRRLKVNRKVIPDPLDDYRGPTAERVRHAGGAVEEGSDQRGIPTGIRTMRDAPIERLYQSDKLTDEQYRAAVKFRHHWYHAGLCSPIQSVDLNRVFASDSSSFSGMAKTEAQAFHRKIHRLAIQAVGVQSGYLLQTVICEEIGLDEAGKKLSWGNRPQAVAAATERLKVALDQLCTLWGI